MKWFCLIIIFFNTLSIFAERIKDITMPQGLRSDQLIGYGLVTGLNGNGDTGASYTKQSFSSLLKRFGINIPQKDITSNNIAAVMVTANINSFVKEGGVLDVTISSIGDCKTLQGGVLLQTPLIGADDVVYALASGKIVVGGFFAGASGSGGSTIQKNHPTVGMISGGAIVERAIPAEIMQDGCMDLLLLNPDQTSAVRIAQAINERYPASSQAIDFGTVNIKVPDSFKGQLTNFCAVIGDFQVKPDTVARVVINERTGTIVATKDVRISEVAMSYGSLVMSVASQENVSQPNAFSQTGTTAQTNSTDTTAKETRGGFRMIDDYPSVDLLAAGLNAFGVSTRDMISIFQTIHASGALQAELLID